MDIDKLTILINEIVESKISKMQTNLIGRIESINSDKTLNIQPVLKRMVGEEIMQLPIIKKVPFFQKSSSDGYEALELKVGDHVLCLALQRNYKNFFQTLDIDIAATKRQYDISDIIALPYFYAKDKKIEDEILGWGAKSKSSIKLNLNDTSFIELKDNKIKIEANGTDVLELISQTLQALSVSTVSTYYGAAPLNNANQFTLLKSAIDNIKA